MGVFTVLDIEEKSKIGRYMFVTLILVSLLAVPTSAEEFNLSLGSVSLHYVQHNPIEIEVTDGEKGSTAMKLITAKYSNQTNIGSEESRFDFSLDGLAEKLTLDAEIKDGSLKSSTKWPGGGSQLSVRGENLVTTYVMDKTGDGEAASKQVEVLVQAEAETGILRVNYDNNTVKLPSDEEKVSNQLGISRLEARNILDSKGKTRVLKALEEANEGNPNGDDLLDEGASNAAGGAGSVASGSSGSVAINNLDSQSRFSFYYDGPNYKARIRDSEFNLKLLFPGNGTQIKGVGVNITVAGPVGNGEDSDRIVLMDDLEYDEKNGYYSYSFKEGNWLIDRRQLEPGGYNLYIDVSPALTTKLGITITDDNQVMEGRY